jgi:hypothetical protein
MCHVHVQFVFSHFAGAAVVDEHTTMVNFEIPKQSITRLSAAFATLESEKSNLSVVDYALSQSTLEQVTLLSTSCYFILLLLGAVAATWCCCFCVRGLLGNVRCGVMFCVVCG